MTDNIASAALDILRNASGPSSMSSPLINMDMAASMLTVSQLSDLLLEAVGESEVIITAAEANDLVLGYEVARKAGAERAVLHEDAGILTLNGAPLDGRTTALVTVMPPRTSTVDALRRIVERAGGSLGTVASVLNEDEAASFTSQHA